MKQLITALVFPFLVPAWAQAQLEVILEGSRPGIRADVGPLVLSAGVSSRGVDLSVGERRTTARVPTTRQPRPTTRTGTTTRTRTSTTRTSRGGARASASAAAILTTADRYVGTRYVWGGETPRGFDCSGFVQYVFRQHGVELPRTSRQQVQVGRSVGRSLDALAPGDLLFFASNGRRIDHIAIFVGGNEIIHSSSSGGGVGYDSFTTRRGQWFLAHHVATRRVLADGYSLVSPLTAALRAFAGYDPPDRAPRR